MCGFFCAISNLPLRVDHSLLRSAVDAQRHRGPDDVGEFLTDRVFLGFRRLSIIDLSERAHQPMISRGERYVIVFNGEIYNFRTLRRDLVDEGWHFDSESDTEVVLALFQKYGEGFLKFLQGMFSLAIYDSEEHSLFLARDAFGQKPLLYSIVNDILYVGEEIKSFLSLPGFDRCLDRGAVAEFFALGSIRSPRTIFRSIASLPPGNCAQWRDGVLRNREFWSLSSVKEPEWESIEDARTNVRKTLVHVCEEHLISDVPLGIFLSGGLDSSILTGIVSRILGHSVQTTSVEFADAVDVYNEDRDYAIEVAKFYETRHHRVVVSEQDVRNSIEHFVWSLDQPSCDGMNTYFVAKAAREQVVVSLSGLGSDELFYGYSAFKMVEYASRYRGLFAALPSNLRSSLSKSLRNLPGERRVLPSTKGLLLLLEGEGAHGNQYRLLHEIFTPREISMLLRSEASDSGLQSDLNGVLDSSPSDAFSREMIQSYLHPTLLRDSDVMGMCHSLEIRNPFVDRRVAEVAASIPWNFKIRNGRTKVVLKEAFEDILPREVVNRRKRGFLFPLVVWLRRGALKELMEDVLSQVSVSRRGILDADVVAGVKHEFLTTRSDQPRMYLMFQRVWTLIVFEMWCRAYLDSE